jgi:hypothetical protein
MRSCAFSQNQFGAVHAGWLLSRVVIAMIYYLLDRPLGFCDGDLLFVTTAICCSLVTRLRPALHNPPRWPQ